MKQINQDVLDHSRWRLRAHRMWASTYRLPAPDATECSSANRRNQQMCRNLGHDTIVGRIRLVERFVEYMFRVTTAAASPPRLAAS
ncbi:hypothetical protein F0Q45_04640 [Mycobacterium simiae]|uniref:Uncharacterized protein n=1 Tax=Mycobacterium simiae TaxID=1784 RepID=A0A5B1BVI5_MYCSI|nr:hypothetical protein F0Q45_04640 [Mycobacterium simiae]